MTATNKDDRDRVNASFVMSGRKMDLLNAAAQKRGQRVGSAARDLAVLYLETQLLSGNAGVESALSELAGEVRALRLAIADTPESAKAH